MEKELEKDINSIEEKIIAMIPLRGINVFPGMVIHFDVGREKSIKALESAMVNEQEIFLVSQRKAKTEEPTEEDIYNVGTICTIKQLLKLPGDAVRVLVEGKYRAKITEYKETEPFFKVIIKDVEDIYSKEQADMDAVLRSVEKHFEEYVKLAGNTSGDSLLTLEDIEDASKFADSIASYLILKGEEKQELLQTEDVYSRLEKLLQIIIKEIEILTVEKKIGLKVKGKIEKSQKEFFLREQMKAIQEELGEDDEEKKEIDDYNKKIVKAKLPSEVKEKALYELNRLKLSGGYSSESSVIRTYLDSILDLPWNKITKDNLDIKKVKEVLDKEHYGLENVKKRIIEYLSVRKRSPKLNGPILCFVGPPGVGKTSIARSIATSVNRNFVRMSLGGVRDEAEIRGHRRTYVGAIPGRVISGMKQAKSKNPLFLLDEIDKMSNDFRGNPGDALLEVLDAEQNSTFRDHYLELDFDLSKVMFVTTANTLDTIPRPLLDRMEVIEVSGYTFQEKFHIANNHLIPKALKVHNVENGIVCFSNASIKVIIENYTRESGVRNLERKISSVIRKAITELEEKNKESINITVNHVRKYLGTEIFTYDSIDKEDKVGVVTGLAWTAYGGDTLPVEVSVMQGNGKLQLTGKLGEVMQESAKTAYSYVRSMAKEFGIKEDFYKNNDIHIHVPEGAVPKDGPSAGITMVTALVSALSGRKVKHNVAMTGEVTLIGRVLPIGGLKEKALSAYRAGIDTIIIPKENEKNLKDIPASLKSRVNFIPVTDARDVIKNALIGEKENEN
ncbi:endopeptidase La [Hathewaya histolytica]|uniref:Lon protease n=2 Tax=Hathewaya histolytica TaxID=1498 RepID=A0A4U9R4B2_HATHI|nr:endopeptidase LA [Hathewaya histolytica]